MTTGAPPPHRNAPRSRARTFLPLAVAAWLVLEIWLLIVVAGAAGGFTVFLLIVAGIVLGSAVLKRAGRRAFRNFTETVQRQQSGLAPEPEKGTGNALTMLGGLLLIMPGMISDVLGLLCLVPPVRKVVGRYAERSLERRMRAAGTGTLGDAFQQARMHRPDGKVVPGEVIRDEEPPAPGRDQDPRPPLTP